MFSSTLSFIIVNAPALEETGLYRRLWKTLFTLANFTGEFMVIKLLVFTLAAFFKKSMF